MESKKRAGYIRQEKWHEERIDNPSRSEWLLRRAVKKAGLDLVGYEYKLVDEEEEKWYWFDVALNVNGQLVLIDLTGGYAEGGGSNRRREIEQEKKDLCQRLDIPLLTIPKGRGTMETAARIHAFVIGINKGE